MSGFSQMITFKFVHLRFEKWYPLPLMHMSFATQLRKA